MVLLWLNLHEGCWPLLNVSRWQVMWPVYNNQFTRYLVYHPEFQLWNACKWFLCSNISCLYYNIYWCRILNLSIFVINLFKPEYVPNAMICSYLYQPFSHNHNGSHKPVMSITMRSLSIILFQIIFRDGVNSNKELSKTLEPLKN